MENPSNIVPDQLIVLEGDAGLVPKASSGDVGKVLGVLNSSGDVGWVPDQEGMAQVQADWDQTDSSQVSYIANKPDLSVYATTSAMNTALADKQDTISDLSDIRSGAAKGDTAVQPAALEDYATTSAMNTALAGKQNTISDLDTIRAGAALGATAAQPSDLPSSDELLPSASSGDAGKILSVDSNGEPIWQTPSSVTVDQTYNASSTNAQSGTAVAQAIAAIPAPSVDEVPAVTSSDDGKVLTASYSGGVGSYAWETAQGGGGGTPVELPALAFPAASHNTIRFEFESSSFNPSTDSTLSTRGTWTKVTADPNRNVWDVDTQNTQKLFQNKITSSVCLCKILDSYFYLTELAEYFSYCSGITSFNGKFIAGSASLGFTTNNMFESCANLKSVEIHQVLSVSSHEVDYYPLKFGYPAYMFYACSNLETISFGGVKSDGMKLAKVAGSCQSMCQSCYKLRTFSGMDLSTTYNVARMFQDCYSLENLYPSFIVCSGTAADAFIGCMKLKHIDKLAANDLSGAFSGCISLTSVGVVDASSASSLNMMCDGCGSLNDIYVINTESVTDMNFVFRNCQSMRLIPDMSYNAVTTIKYAFYNMKVVSSGASALYTQLSALPNISSHDRTFSGCGSNTASGRAELAQIPSDWK